MTVNISKHLLGIACIIAGAFTPPNPGHPNLAAPRVRSRGCSQVNPLHHHPDAPDGHGRNRAGERPGVVGSLRPGREQPGATAPERAPTLLTGAVGMLLLFIHLFEGISSSSRISPTAALYVYALTSTVLLMETA